MAKIYKDLTGKGPKTLKTCIIEDLIIIKFSFYDIETLNNFKKIEFNGEKIISVIYRAVFEHIKPQIKDYIEKNINTNVKDIFFDAENNAMSEEKIMVIVFEKTINSK